MNGLLIKQPWIDKILCGEKTWEIRGTQTVNPTSLNLEMFDRTAFVEDLELAGPFALFEETA